eukprot:Gregarina_sp_Poly_1__3549@NODE_2037_length_2801_cov_97_328822_g1314_i0_p4_GENE_NODE_2037_length_2801_cov_97_328822_g1314_i0NODE_2037_length_2801_cov_97_328822_g1314_i0_p4_ORF_typecomplete_len100_score8_42CelD_N/PF02927_14/0_031_NODE_2037_length_2801_cov_97_328822_g1314_i047346
MERSQLKYTKLYHYASDSAEVGLWNSSRRKWSRWLTLTFENYPQPTKLGDKKLWRFRNYSQLGYRVKKTKEASLQGEKEQTQNHFHMKQKIKTSFRVSD